MSLTVSNIWIVLVIGLGTYLMRAGSILLGSQVEWSAKTKEWLYYVTPAVLGALLGPLLFMNGTQFIPIMHNAVLWGAIPTVIVAWYSRNLWLTIAVGVISYTGVQYLLNWLGW